VAEIMEQRVRGRRASATIARSHPRIRTTPPLAPRLRWRRGLERPAAEAEEMKREDGARRDAIGRNHEEFAY
jgi:hypothetical protein